MQSEQAPIRMHRARRWAWVWVAALLAVFAVLPARNARAAATPVIEAGREAEVLALLAPYRLTDEVAADWRLWNVSISAQEIEIELVGPGASSAHVRLVHPSRAKEGAEHSASFALLRDDVARAAAAPAAAALSARVKQNDHGGFWREPSQLGASRIEPTPEGAATRGLAWPIAFALLSAGGMWLVARRVATSG